MYVYIYIYIRIVDTIVKYDKMGTRDRMGLSYRLSERQRGSIAC